MHFLIGCLKHAFYRFGIHCFPALPHHSPAFTLISNAFLFISTAFALHSPAFAGQSPCIHLCVPCIPSYLFHPAPRISLVETCIPLHSIQSLSFPQQTQFFNPTGSPIRRDAPRCAAMRRINRFPDQRSGRQEGTRRTMRGGGGGGGGGSGGGGEGGGRGG